MILFEILRTHVAVHRNKKILQGRCVFVCRVKPKNRIFSFDDENDGMEKFLALNTERRTWLESNKKNYWLMCSLPMDPLINEIMKLFTDSKLSFKFTTSFHWKNFSSIELGA